MPRMNDWGALFDWDGVVIDSSRQHEAAWEKLATEEGRVLPPDHFKKGFGMKNSRIIPDLLEWTREPDEIGRLSGRKEEIYREIVRANGIEPLPGVVSWLKELSQAGVPCVIASSTEKKNITTILAVTGLGGYFRAIVSAEDVKKGKPDPEVFLFAAQQAGRPPGRCVVFEDALVGIQAGKAAGAKVIGVTTTHPDGKLPGADHIVTRLDELSVPFVREKLLGL